MSDQKLKTIGHQLRTQDNRITSNPMFCVQRKVRDVGYDHAYSDNRCWHSIENETTIYDDDKDFKEPEGGDWEEFGYRDRWETVMTAFTEEGCKEYLRLNGHNLGETRIYVESFNRCPEMILIRESLIGEAFSRRPREQELEEGVREAISVLKNSCLALCCGYDRNVSKEVSENHKESAANLIDETIPKLSALLGKGTP